MTLESADMNSLPKSFIEFSCNKIKNYWTLDSSKCCRFDPGILKISILRDEYEYSLSGVLEDAVQVILGDVNRLCDDHHKIRDALQFINVSKIPVWICKLRIVP